MYYWLALFTFIASMLFYSFYPRSDAVKMVDKPKASVLVEPFIAQHLVALDAVQLKDNDDVMAYIPAMAGTTSGLLTVPAGGYGKIELDKDAFGHFNTTSIVFNNQFTSAVFCILNETPSTEKLTTSCGQTAGSMATTDFLVTYGSVPESWGYYGMLAPRVLGEKAFLAPYDEKYHARTQCGVVDMGDGLVVRTPTSDFDPESGIVLNNSRYQVVTVPRYIAAKLNLAPRDLMCITRLSAAYDFANPPKIIYPQ